MSTISFDAPEARSGYPSSKFLTTNYYQTGIKITVWTLGLIVLCLAMVDFYAQTHANETGIALQSAQNEKLEINEDLRISDIDKYIVGSPVVRTRPADKYTNMCKQMKEYTWKGFFKNYSISVYLGLGSDPSVDYVHGPGDLVKESNQKSSSL